jgi:hypothetical protein
MVYGVGTFIFAVLAVLVVYAFIKVKRRDREYYEHGE